MGFKKNIREKGEKKSGIGKMLFSHRRTTIETESGESYFVFDTYRRDYVHGDTVKYIITRPASGGKLAEAKPVDLIRRCTEILLVVARKGRHGIRWHIMDGFGILDISVSEEPPGFKDGDIYTGRFRGKKEIILDAYFGRSDDLETEEMIILMQHGIRTGDSWGENNSKEEGLQWGSGGNVEKQKNGVPVQRGLGGGNDVKIKHGEGTSEGSVATTETFGTFSHKSTEKKLDSGIKPEGQEYKSISKETKLKDLPFGTTTIIHERERLDFRAWPTITIDGADARDLDDAISIARYEGGDYLLGVHIADVSEYVREGTSLDREAYLRGTSVYTPGRVIPMLPEYLSNDLCSLHPGSAKAVLSILIRLDTGGNVKETLITEGVIESIHRGVYEEIGKELKMMQDIQNQEPVDQGFGGDDEKQGTQRGSGENIAHSDSLHRGFGGGNDVKIKYREGASEGSVATTETFGTFSHKSTEGKESTIEESLKNFYSLYKILEKKRKKEGKILFEMTECYFDVDEKRNVTNIRKRKRGEAHMLIEEFMILANEEVAKWCAKEHLPFLSRVHTAPESEDMRKISEILKDNSLAHRIEPHHIREHLERATDPRERYRLSRLILPKMSKAHYGDSPRGHFGLALAYYSHFTSPIRRYPDLLVHRIIKMQLTNTLHKDKKSEYTRRMKQIGKSLSEKEKRAETAERAIDSLMMCRYMSEKVGREYHGTISGLTESNIYVELENGVEGSIFLGGKSSSRKEKLTLDERDGSMRNSAGKTLYRIGDPIDIKILSVDMKERRIELTLL